jgi:hypothetical protein
LKTFHIRIALIAAQTAVLYQAIGYHICTYKYVHFAPAYLLNVYLGSYEMPIQRDISPDFNSPAVCAFLLDHSKQDFSELSALQADQSANGFTFHKGKRISSTKISLRTFKIHKLNVLDYISKRRVNSIELADPVDHPIELIINSYLFVKSTINPIILAVLIDEFTKFTPGVDDVDDIETSIIRRGAAVGDYRVILQLELVRAGTPQCLDINYNSFLSQIDGYRAGIPRRRYYEVELIADGVSESCEFAAPPESKITVVKDIEHPENEISAIEKRRRPKGCDELELTDHRIGTAFQYYEWKIEWLVRPIRIGSCEIMHTKIPVLFSRITKQALWGVAMTEPQIKNNSRKGIEGCLEEAAYETGALVIVSGGMGLAAAGEAFASSFMDCVGKWLADAVRCVVASLHLVAESDNWQEKGF